MQHIWKYQLYDRQSMKTVAGEEFQVISAGIHNSDAGPDFVEARIKIGDTIWVGSVEIHRQASDWNLHKHSANPAYDNVILHVVVENNCEITTCNNRQIPVYVMKYNAKMAHNYNFLYESRRWIPCESCFGAIDSTFLNIWIESVFVGRLERKYAETVSLLASLNNDFNELFYRLLVRNFGFKVNSIPFERLACSLPLSVIKKFADNRLLIEAALFGQAGLLASETGHNDDYKALLCREYDILRHRFGLTPMSYYEWKFFRLRPANFPSTRIAQLSAMFATSVDFTGLIVDTHQIDKLYRYFSHEVSEYWRNHYNFGKITTRKVSALGQQSINGIMINTVSPFLFAYGTFNADENQRCKAVEWLEQVPAENNSIVAKWRSLGAEINTARQSQAYLELKSQYCDKLRCLDCQIGCRLVAEI